MNVRKVPLKKLNPAPYNPRVDLQPDDPDYQRIKKSVVTFGPVVPLVWNERTGNLVGGHQRLKVLLERGETEAHVSVVNLDELDERKLNIALNNSHGRNENERLHELLSEIKAEDPENLDQTGYDEARMQQLLETAGGGEEPPGGGDPDPNQKATIQICCPRDMVDEIVAGNTKFTQQPGVRLEVL